MPIVSRLVARPAAPAAGAASGEGLAPIDPDQTQAAVQRWDLRAHCSTSPAGLLAAVGGVGLVSLLIGGFFWWMGAPWVLPFACVEMLCLLLALLIYAGRATDGELMELRGDDLHVRVTRRGRESVSVFPAAWTRVGCSRSTGIELACGAQRLWVGRQVRPEKLPMVAQALQQALQARIRALGPV